MPPLLEYMNQGRIQGGGGPGGQDTPPLLGDPKTSEIGKNVAHMCANAARFST